MKTWKVLSICAAIGFFFIRFEARAEVIPLSIPEHCANSVDDLDEDQVRDCFSQLQSQNSRYKKMLEMQGVELDPAEVVSHNDPQMMPAPKQSNPPQMKTGYGSSNPPQMMPTKSAQSNPPQMAPRSSSSWSWYR